jgi:hypothetical protein
MFDDQDLIELIRLAIYLERKTGRGLFPKARYDRYSDTLMRLIDFLANVDLDDDDDPNGSARLGAALGNSRKLAERSSCREPATVLTHPRFRGRRKPGP